MTRGVKSEPHDDFTSDLMQPLDADMSQDIQESTQDLPPMDVDWDEPIIEEGDDTIVTPAAVTSSLAAGANEEDEIVREMDVFLSPDLTDQLYLIQFPLQQQSDQKPATNEQKPRNPPAAARIRPRHCMIELDYPTNTDSNQDLNGQFFMSARTFSSQTIPVSTHMALGKLIPDGSGERGLHLVPLTHINQMRPNFQHVNESVMNLTSSDNDGIDPMAASALDSNTRRPLSFQKKESERAVLARKSSYAYKKASEDSELWLPLDIHGGKSSEAEQIMSKVACTHPDENLLLTKSANNGVTQVHGGDDQLISSGQVPSSSHGMASSSYVHSLNYLPPSHSIAGAKSDSTEIDAHNLSHADLLAAAVGKLVDLLHQGCPIPFSILRAQFPPSAYSDVILFEALSSCAFLVRGNFIIQSRLMPLPGAVAQARTFILFLLQGLGVVHRTLLDHVFEDDSQVKSEVILMLLEQVAKKTEDGWKLKIDDDDQLEMSFPEIVPLHLNFWKKQVRRFRPLLERYQERASR